MTVSELIENLSKFKGNEYVIIQASEGWFEGNLEIRKHKDALSGEDLCLIVYDESF